MKDFLLIKERFEQNLPIILHDLFSKHSISPQTKLAKAINYSMKAGKRLRPLLVYQVNQLLGGNPLQADKLAVSIELLHNYTLIHDDLPCLDNDKLRRNLPTVHIVFGEAMALLAGDAMQALAFSVISEAENSDLVYSILAESATDMAIGQALEQEGINSSNYQEICLRKTSSLMRCALLFGLIASGKFDDEKIAFFRELGDLLGIAFQLQDDKFDNGELFLTFSEIFAKIYQKIASSDFADKSMLVALIKFIEMRSF